MSSVEKASRRSTVRRKTPSSKPSAVSGSSQARRKAAAILEVLAGVCRPSEAAQALETSLPRYYQMERRALAGLLAACEPPPRGPQPDPLRRVAALERENQRLRRECDRQQALVRAAERSLGLVLAVARPPVKGSDAKPDGDDRKRRQRRPSVRALRAVRMMQSAETTTVPAAAAEAETTVGVKDVG